MGALSQAPSGLSQAATAFVSLTTRDGRLVYLSAAARPARPGLEQVLTSLLYELGRRDFAELHGDRIRLDLSRKLREIGFPVEELEITVSLRCPQCAASLQLSPETVVYVCPYCGWAGDVYGRVLKILAWPPAPRSAVERLAGRLGGTLVSAELRYVPVWVAGAEGAASYRATVTYVVTRQHGKQTVSERRRMSVSGTVSAKTIEPVIARLNAEIFGAEEITEWVRSAWALSKPKELSAEEAKPLAGFILAPEIGKEGAASIVVDTIEDNLAEKAKAEARARAPGSVEDVVLNEFNPKVNVEWIHLVFVPYWYFTYRRPEGLFAGAAVGPEASSRVAEAPLSNMRRAAALAGSWALSLATGAAVESFTSVGLGELAILIFFFGLAGVYFLVRTAYKPARRVRK
ncbi:MAG: hypothetical protein QXU72_02350 [Thermofilum sp.]